MSQKTTKYTSIGGQALIEGVMMMNPKQNIAMAVRTPSGAIDVEQWPISSPGKWYKKTPFVRGIFNFVDTMTLGYTCLMKAAEKAGMEEEPTKFEQKMKDKLGKGYDAFFQGTILIISLLLVMLLFLFLPTFLVGLLRPIITHTIWLTVIESLLKLSIFFAYLLAISNMKDIRRVFQYHGAEHKTIACFEHGEPLTVENVRKYTRFHPRCGTSFLIIVLIFSILMFSFISWGNVLVRMGLKILMLPLILSVCYEIIKIAGRYDNVCTRFISAPGLWAQRFTTREPEDEMIEVAIAAMTAVLPGASTAPSASSIIEEPSTFIPMEHPSTEQAPTQQPPDANSATPKPLAEN